MDTIDRTVYVIPPSECCYIHAQRAELNKLPKPNNCVDVWSSLSLIGWRWSRIDGAATEEIKGYRSIQARARIRRQWHSITWSNCPMGKWRISRCARLRFIAAMEMKIYAEQNRGWTDAIKCLSGSASKHDDSGSSDPVRTRGSLDCAEPSATNIAPRERWARKVTLERRCKTEIYLRS